MKTEIWEVQYSYTIDGKMVVKKQLFKHLDQASFFAIDRQKNGRRRILHIKRV